MQKIPVEISNGFIDVVRKPKEDGDGSLYVPWKIECITKNANNIIASVIPFFWSGNDKC